MVARKSLFIKSGLKLDNMFLDFQRLGFHWNRQAFKLSVVGLTQHLIHSPCPISALFGSVPCHLRVAKIQLLNNDLTHRMKLFFHLEIYTYGQVKILRDLSYENPQILGSKHE